MINDTTKKLVNKENLSYDEAKDTINEVMSGDVSPTLISSFLTALSSKGETDEEIAGAAEGMRACAEIFNTPYPVLDIVGTGGDKSNSFNISTTASLVAATAGVKIAKHGNRAASSKCGTADCLEALGVKIDADKKLMLKSLEEANICFLFAQKYHSAMKYVGPVRKELGFRTVFNVLGPLTNPAKAQMMVLGVFSSEFVSKLASSLVKLGITRAFVVFGNDGLDEISACGETTVAEIRYGKVKEYQICPEDFGLKRCTKEDLLGGTPDENAQITRNILLGNGTDAQNTATILNAGAGIYVNEDGITLKGAMEKAKNIVISGSAIKTLDKFIKITNGENI